MVLELAGEQAVIGIAEDPGHLTHRHAAFGEKLAGSVDPDCDLVGAEGLTGLASEEAGELIRRQFGRRGGYVHVQAAGRVASQPLHYVVDAPVHQRRQVAGGSGGLGVDLQQQRRQCSGGSRGGVRAGAAPEAREAVEVAADLGQVVQVHQARGQVDVSLPGLVREVHSSHKAVQLMPDRTAIRVAGTVPPSQRRTVQHFVHAEPPGGEVQLTRHHPVQTEADRFRVAGHAAMQPTVQLVRCPSHTCRKGTPIRWAAAL